MRCSELVEASPPVGDRVPPARSRSHLNVEAVEVFEAADGQVIDPVGVGTVLFVLDPAPKTPSVQRTPTGRGSSCAVS
jgi:hypothetical protein